MMCVGMIISGNAADTENNITTFPVKGIASVDIRTNSALIYVESVQATDIRVEQLPDNARVCNVTMKVSGKQLVLKALDKAGEYKDIKTGFRVFLPAGISITARTNSGQIGFHETTGSLEARSNSGDIKLDGVSGSLKTTTESGDIEGTVKATETAKEIALKTISGDISVAFPESATLAVDATTTSGKIHNDFSGKAGLPVTARTISGDISITKAGK
jgi:DUF4097 and DUF4098 domain-containing protein YvlB